MFLPWTDLLSLCYGSLWISFLHEANLHLAAIPGTWPWPGACVPSLFLPQNHEETPVPPTCSVHTGALYPGQTPPSCCSLTIMLPCMLISLTGIISSLIVHKCSGHFAEVLTGMRAFIWKVPLHKKSKEILKRRSLSCLCVRGSTLLSPVSPPSFQYLGIDNCWLFNCWGWWNC